MHISFVKDSSTLHLYIGLLYVVGMVIQYFQALAFLGYNLDL